MSTLNAVFNRCEGCPVKWLICRRHEHCVKGLSLYISEITFTNDVEPPQSMIEVILQEPRVLFIYSGNCLRDSSPRRYQHRE